MIPENAYSSKMQLRFNDIDALGHVNNAVQVTYLEVARVNYFQHLMQTKINWDKEGLILAKVTIDYKIPIRIEDAISVQIWCSKVGTKSFDLSYAIVKQANSKQIIMATATSVQVCFNYAENKTIPIPEPWKTKLTANLFPGINTV